MALAASAPAAGAAVLPNPDQQAAGSPAASTAVTPLASPAVAPNPDEQNASAAARATIQTTVAAKSRFSWTDAALRAAVALSVMLLAGAVVVGVTRRRAQPRRRSPRVAI